MLPRFHFRWERPPEDELEAHRQRQGAVPAAAVTLAGDADCPAYRGEHRDGVVHGPALARDWGTQPPLLWRQPGGGGFAAVAGNAAITIEQRRDREAVVCYDAATGRERWVRDYDAHFQEAMGGPGPRATPTIIDGEVYSLGATGRLLCLDEATGRLKWEKDILKDNDNLQWGMSGSPLVYDRVMVVN